MINEILKKHELDKDDIIELLSLTDNKPCLDENAGMCRGCLEMRIRSIGEEIGYNQWGDSPKFKAEQSGRMETS